MITGELIKNEFNQELEKDVPVDFRCWNSFNMNPNDTLFFPDSLESESFDSYFTLSESEHEYDSSCSTVGKSGPQSSSNSENEEQLKLSLNFDFDDQSDNEGDNQIKDYNEIVKNLDFENDTWASPVTCSLKTPKKMRKTKAQIKILKKEFENNIYWDQEDKMNIAALTGLDFNQVYKWHHTELRKLGKCIPKRK